MLATSCMFSSFPVPRMFPGWSPKLGRQLVFFNSAGPWTGKTKDNYCLKKQNMRNNTTQEIIWQKRNFGKCRKIKRKKKRASENNQKSKRNQKKHLGWGYQKAKKTRRSIQDNHSENKALENHSGNGLKIIWGNRQVTQENA